MSDLQSLVQKLDSLIENQTAGMPEEVFLLVSRVTPLGQCGLAD